MHPPEAAAARQAQVDQALAHFAARHSLAPGHQAGCLHSLAEQLDQLSAAKAGGQAPIARQQIEALPVFVQLDNVPSDFVELRVVMSTEDLTQDQRAYLELYLEAAFSLPVRRPAGLASCLVPRSLTPRWPSPTTTRTDPMPRRP